MMIRKIVIISALLVSVFVLPKTGFSKNGIKIEISDLIITKSDKASFIQLGFSKNDVLEIFGKPLEIKRAYFTEVDFKGVRLKYKGAEFYFMDDKLEAFEITNNRFTVKIKGKDTYAVVGKYIKNFRGLQ